MRHLESGIGWKAGTAYVSLSQRESQLAGVCPFANHAAKRGRNVYPNYADCQESAGIFARSA